MPLWKPRVRRVGLVSVTLAATSGLALPFLSPAPAGATPDPAATERLVIQLNGQAETHAAEVLGPLPGSVPTLLPGQRWILDVPTGEVAGLEAELARDRGVNYVSTVGTVHATAAPPSAAPPSAVPASAVPASAVPASALPASALPASALPASAVPTSALPASAVQQAGAVHAPASAVHAQASGQVTPNDPCYAQTCGPSNPVVEDYLPAGSGASDVAHPNGQTDLMAVNAPQAWAVTEGSPNVLVAVLDSGVDAAHPDLQGKVTVGADVCVSDDPLCTSTADNLGHGTHVTGIIAAATNNGTGIASLGWNTSAIVFKVLDDQGSGTTADTATGIYDAVAAGARVINMSLANDPCNVDPANCGPDPDEQAAVDYALAHNVVVVAAAGNSDSNEPCYPASYPGVLSVAAASDAGVVNQSNGGAGVDFSEYGSAANIAAPGLDVLSTWKDGNYAVLSGTSMATPHVAAAAALVLAADPALSGPQVASILEETASPLAGGGTPISGGMLNAGAAVTLAAQAASSPVVASQVTRLSGYQLVTGTGATYDFGTVPFSGTMAGQRLAKPVVGEATTADGLGSWLVAGDGGVFALGDAGYFGSMGGKPLNKPVVGMATTPDGKGYWLVASDGGIFAFGDAGFYGSTGGRHLDKPVVGMATTPDGKGYWLVASDGGIFAFGDAGFFGSMGGKPLNKPVVGLATTPDGRGYWLVASDGGIFSYGDAGFHGSTGGEKLVAPIVGMVPTESGGGYWLAAADGGIFAFGSASFYGSEGGAGLPSPVVAASS